jgi:hypothetical protein
MDIQKTSLTPQEKLRAASAHLLDGIDQHKIAFIYGVNPGRVAEAVSSVRHALGFPVKEKKED